MSKNTGKRNLVGLTLAAVMMFGSAFGSVSVCAAEAVEAQQTAKVKEAQQTAKVKEAQEADEADEADEAAEADEAKKADDAPEGSIEFGGSDRIDKSAFTGDGTLTTFIGENFYDGVVEDEEDALEAIGSVMKEIGGDDNTVLSIADTTETEDAVYYTFRQYAGDMTVYGASVKLITDLKGNVLGLVSSILPGIKADPEYKWKIDEDEAEAVVKELVKKDGLTIITGATEQTLLPDSSDEDLFHYVWVVYTDYNDPETEQRYLAHYVDSEGNYLYCTPVSEAANADDRSGSTAAFVFEDVEPDTWTGTVTWHDGNKKKITVPVIVDHETGQTYLGDADRKILCADFSDYTFNKTVTPVVPGKYEWFNEAVVNYYEFIRTYDIYEEMGWAGPDGRETASLILIHYTDEDGKPVDDTCYSGMEQGFRIFEMSGTIRNGEPLDIIAHEFTHCVSNTAMTMGIYMNDYGSIDESLSDIMGNSIEMILDGTTEKTGAWQIGEGEGMDEPLRSMSDPHLFKQPEFVWDMYYVPNVTEGTELNDNGGVHINSSLLNLISYDLDQAGMEPEDQVYFWMNVMLAITPRTDFNLISELLPWCMEVSGYSDFVDVVKDSIEETGIAGVDFPGEPVGNLSMLAISFEPGKIAEGYDIMAGFYNYDDENAFETWPIRDTGLIAASLPEGTYTVIVRVYNSETVDSVDYIYSEDRWEEVEDVHEILEKQDPAFMGRLEKGNLAILEF